LAFDVPFPFIRRGRWKPSARGISGFGIAFYLQDTLPLESLFPFWKQKTLALARTRQTSAEDRR
jgi:hypothetical protein